ncbi:uncharacterized protein LOC141852865 isoform X2 [Brevipalpus obovatus]
MSLSPLNSNSDQRYEDTSPGSSAAANVQSSSSVKFPQKLWNIVEDPNDTSITWTESGETLQIDLSSFQVKYLSKRATTFKTNNMASFIRQLNLYGFRKVNNQTDVHEYRHPNFRRGRSDLLKGVTRRYPNQQNAHQQTATNDRQSNMIRDMTDPRFNSQRGDERGGGGGGSSASFWNDIDFSGKMRFPHMSPQKVLESTSLFINESMAVPMSNYETHVPCPQHLNLSAISPSSSSSSAHLSSSSTSRRYSPSSRDNSNNLSVPVQKFRQLLIPNNDDQDIDSSQMQEPLDFRKHRRSDDLSIVPPGINMMPSHLQYPSMERFGGSSCDVISSPRMFPFFPGNDAGSSSSNPLNHHRDQAHRFEQRSPFGGSSKHRSHLDEDEDEDEDEEAYGNDENDVINVEDLSDDEESEERDRSEDSSYTLQRSRNPQHNFAYRNYGERDDDSENQESRTDEDDQEEDDEISDRCSSRKNEDDSDEEEEDGEEEEEEEEEEEDDDEENEDEEADPSGNYNSRYRGMPSRGRVENRPLSAFDSVFASDTPSDSYFF